MKELDRVLSLHYSEDMEVIRRCCYSADGEPPTVGDKSLSSFGSLRAPRAWKGAKEV